MPNFWNKTAQLLDEAFNGPRTKDTEFDTLALEVTEIENGVMSLKEILQKFGSYSEGLKQLFHDISHAIPYIYNNSSPFQQLGKMITDAHIKMEIYFDSYLTNVNRLLKKTTEWGVLFSQSKKLISKREDFRKTYDHYDEKLEKLLQKFKEKKKILSSKEIEEKNRNIEKFKQATEVYVKSSDESYKAISDVLNRRYDMINPVLLEFINEEMQFFKQLSQTCNNFDGIDQRFLKIKKSIPDNPVSDYNPCRYIRGGLLIIRDKIINESSELKTISTEECFNRTVVQCQKETKFLTENAKDSDDEDAYIAKKPSLRAQPDKKKSFNDMPDQLSSGKNLIINPYNFRAKTTAYRPDYIDEELITKDLDGDDDIKVTNNEETFNVRNTVKCKPYGNSNHNPLFDDLFD